MYVFTYTHFIKVNILWFKPGWTESSSSGAKSARSRRNVDSESSRKSTATPSPNRRKPEREFGRGARLGPSFARPDAGGGVLRGGLERAEAQASESFASKKSCQVTMSWSYCVYCFRHASKYGFWWYTNISITQKYATVEQRQLLPENLNRVTVNL
jgi:hypothetical protein